MKHCTYCGKEYSDEVEVCPIDGNPVRRVGEAQTPVPVVQGLKIISPQEQRFWERMTFKQFAIVIVRLQAVWLFVDAAAAATSIPRYFIRSGTIAVSSDLSPAMKLELFMLIVRMVLYVAVAMTLIQRSEKILSWLVKDFVAKEAL